jgi:hypothetical protein
MPETIKEPVRRIHPGSGRRKGRPTPKGRQVDPQALDDVRALSAPITENHLGPVNPPQTWNAMQRTRKPRT